MRQLHFRFREAIMRKSVIVAVAGAAALAVSSPVPIAAQGDTNQQLGNVHFETSCNEVAQRRFDRAMRYQHSFWYDAARDIFQEAAAADPTCGMAYWGVALTYLDNPHNPIPAPNIPLGLAAIQKAKAVGANTERERGYIDALTFMYADADKLTHVERIHAYLKAMEALAAKNPNDDEAQIAYAITLNTSASPSDKTYVQQRKGAAILEPIWKRQPQHPGIAHYLIHLYDYPALANDGLRAAELYSKIAPAAPHAQHMPSHIFTRVGYWKESIASNIASVKAAKTEKEYGSAFHGEDYMVYAYLQLADDKDARSVIDDMKALPAANSAAFGSHFAMAASPARYMVERGDWAGAAELEVRPSPFPHVMAITHFARALGAARSGKPDAAGADIAKLAELRDKLREAKNGYWAQQVDIQWQIANAWMLNAEGKTDEALKAMSAAADVEDKTDKSPVTPGPLAPARELYGDMLLEHGMAKEALAAFEATKAKEPNRLHGFAGAAKAAEKLGDRAAAKANYEKLVAMTGTAASDRPDVKAAAQFLGKS
jgi:predicted Zn-dependent protease